MKTSGTSQAVPSIRSRAFDCPHCGIRAHQLWFEIQATKLSAESTPTLDLQTRRIRWQAVAKRDRHSEYLVREPLKRIESKKPVLMPVTDSIGKSIENIWLAQCNHCADFSVWISDRMVWPESHSAPSPHPDMPDTVRSEYEEARAIVAKSPRGAAALLRLSIELLCEDLNAAGRTLNAKIAALVTNGLNVRTQRALDAVRVIGNNVVHPGKMDIRDDLDTANTLFALVNFIVEEMISKPQHMNSIYASLPEASRAAIEKRDASR